MWNQEWRDAYGDVQLFFSQKMSRMLPGQCFFIGWDCKTIFYCDPSLQCKMFPLMALNQKVGMNHYFLYNVSFFRLQELAAQKFQRDSSAAVSFPREWAPMESEEMKTVDIPDSSKDYTTIRDIFRMSMPNASILVIKRVQNRTLWIMFRM